MLALQPFQEIQNESHFVFLLPVRCEIIGVDAAPSIQRLSQRAHDFGIEGYAFRQFLQVDLRGDGGVEALVEIQRGLLLPKDEAVHEVLACVDDCHDVAALRLVDAQFFEIGIDALVAPPQQKSRPH